MPRGYLGYLVEDNETILKPIYRYWIQLVEDRSIVADFLNTVINCHVP
jgi:hypothetical protein